MNLAPWPQSQTYCPCRPVAMLVLEPQLALTARFGEQRRFNSPSHSCAIQRLGSLPRPAFQNTDRLRCSAMEPNGAFLGLDFGTSGARGTVIDDSGSILADVRTGYGAKAHEDWAAAWERSLFELIDDLPASLKSHIASIAFDGTSATAMLVDRASGAQLAAPKLYNEAQGKQAVEAAKALAPPAHTATASTSTLCKLLAWHLAGEWQRAAAAPGVEPCLMHQADWLASLLHGHRNVSDWNNALKLGFDPATEAYPDWMTSQEWAPLLPARVVAPGAAVAPLTPQVAARTGLPHTCMVAAGTTDSIAAFVAAGVSRPGEAVTSLGSTMAIKMLSTVRVDDAAYGLYSHRLGDMWLVGGASNTGGAVLRSFFTDAQLIELTDRMDIATPTGLQYYPLTKAGERFPVNDPHMAPQLEPRPQDDALFLQGMLESMSRIEARAYQLMHDLGARPRVSCVHTAGGGAANPKWTQLRAQAIGAPVLRSTQGEASYGAALLALQSVRKPEPSLVTKDGR